MNTIYVVFLALAAAPSVLAVKRSQSRPASSLRVQRASSWEADLVKLDTSVYPDALCNDGSPGAYYWRPAAEESDATSWVIALEGGGECTTQDNCEPRLNGPLGSSSHYAKKGIQQWLVSPNPKENPDAHSWNQVRIKYCSSDLHIGTMRATDDPEWGSMRFSGYHVVMSVLDHLNKTQGLDNASRVILTGESAGGIAVFSYLDDLADRLPEARVVGVPIAGYYWDNQMDYSGAGAQPWGIGFGKQHFKNHTELWRAQLPHRCTSSAEARKEPWTCVLSHVAFRTLESPVFVVEAIMDQTQMSFHNHLPYCTANSETKTFCKDFGITMSDSLEQVAERAQRDPSMAGLFAPECVMHHKFTEKQPLINERSYVQAFGDWYKGTESGATILKEECCNFPLKNPTCP